MKNIKNFFDNVIQLVDSTRKDAFANIYTGIGTDNSRTENYQFYKDREIRPDELTNLYRTNGIARRIVDMVVEDAIRNFIECEPELIEELMRLKIKTKLKEAGSFGRLYGGALIVAFIDDGLELDKPVNEKLIQRIKSFEIIDRNQVTIEQQDIPMDVLSVLTGEPNFYLINDLKLKIHKSRCYRFHGNKIPYMTKKRNMTTKIWDDSILQGCYEALKQYSVITQSSCEILQDFVQPIFKMKDLSMKLVQKNGEDLLAKRLDIFNMSRSIAKTVLIDADGEDYQKLTASIAEMPAMWDRHGEYISAVTGIPITKLFGRSPAGMNATGENDTHMYYDTIRAYRTDQIEPAIRWIINLVQNQKNWTNKPANFEFKFPSLYTPNDSELSRIKETYAKIDATYIDRGAVDAGELWEARYRNGMFNPNVSVNKLQGDDLDHTILDAEKILNEEKKLTAKQKKDKEEKLAQIVDHMHSQIKLNA